MPTICKRTQSNKDRGGQLKHQCRYLPTFILQLENCLKARMNTG